MVIRTTPCTADALIWRITLSAPLFRLVTYGLVRASPEKGCFRVHPNESVSVIWSKHRGNAMLKGENRVSVSRGMLFPHQPGDPTKLPAAILRGAPFGYSSPTREEFSPLSLKYCYPFLRVSSCSETPAQSLRRTQAGFTDEVPQHGNVVPPPSLRAFLPHSE